MLFAENIVVAGFDRQEYDEYACADLAHELSEDWQGRICCSDDRPLPRSYLGVGNWYVNSPPLASGTGGVELYYSQ